VRQWAADLKRFDFSGADVKLASSVPGRHKGDMLRKYGHLQLRDILKTETTPPQFHNNPSSGVM